jgi:beta-lactamase superfamily II metal-dependent hydrolase
MPYPAPISYYTNKEAKPLLFHSLHVGEGLMIIVIFPDQTTMLYDCNVRDEDADWIIEYLGKNIPYRYDPEIGEESQWIDIFVSSHRDQDHYRGLSKVNSDYEIKSIWDSGQTGETTLDSDYNYYMRLRRTLMDNYGEDSVIVPVPSLAPLISCGSAEVYCLCSSQDFTELSLKRKYSTAILKEAKVQHTNCVVLSIHYAGRSILLPGDSDWKAWKEKIVPKFGNSGLLRSNILVASHHGSRSFFTDEEENENIDPLRNPDTTYIESIDYIKPSIVLISCGEYSQSHHPNAEALEIYDKNTPYYPKSKQVCTTIEKGTFAGFIDAYGNWTVAPARFHPRSNGSASFDINCIMEYEGSRERRYSRDEFPVGCNVEFTISPHGGLTDPYEAVDVRWEVSNGGINKDHDHQDIYYKSSKDKGNKLEFFREVRYEGTHLLRCRITNRKKGFDVTRVFVVRGVPTR